jgi:iron complex outermembrane receptor protein
MPEAETHAVATVSVAELERSLGDDLGETLRSVPGVAVARGNSDSTKPIIRGQVERRLLVLFDSVRHESQKWGLDHATEIDPFAAGEIHVIKGAAGVRYGPDAVGGVVLVDPPPLRAIPGVGGKAQLLGAMNGLRGVVAGRVDVAPLQAPGFAFRVEGNYARGAALSTPTYVLGNTGSREWNAGATLGYTRRRLQLELSYHHFDLQSGVCYCVRSGTPAEFLAQLDARAPISSELWTTTFAIDRPRQTVRHDIALARATISLPDGGEAKLTYAFQVNHREEFDQVRASITGPQFDFTLQTHSLDASWEHPEIRLPRGVRMRGGAGASGTFQENTYRGLPLIPNFRALQVGVFGFERLTMGPVQVEGGARYDHLSRTAYLTPTAFRRSVARDTLSEEDCEVGEKSARCPVTYDAGTVSLGALWHAVPDRLDARLDLSSATRFPNADELYMNGTAPTFPVYGLGDPSLGPETTWGLSPTLGLRLPWVEAELSAYVNAIHDYVYFAPERGDAGTALMDVTLRGAFPRFTSRPIDALFYGVDGGVTFGPDAIVSLRLQGSIVRALDTASRVPLVMIPADRVEVALRLAPARAGPFRNAFYEVSGLYVFRKAHVELVADLAPPPDGYFLLDAGFGGELQLGRAALKLGLEAHNILNARYRDYSSLLRYFADEPGLDLRVRLGVDF